MTLYKIDNQIWLLYKESKGRSSFVSQGRPVHSIIIFFIFFEASIIYLLIICHFTKIIIIIIYSWVFLLFVCFAFWVRKFSLYVYSFSLWERYYNLYFISVTLIKCFLWNLYREKEERAVRYIFCQERAVT